jgi:hypothetical protein
MPFARLLIDLFNADIETSEASSSAASARVFMLEHNQTHRGGRVL